MHRSKLKSHQEEFRKFTVGDSQQKSSKVQNKATPSAAELRPLFQTLFLGSRGAALSGILPRIRYELSSGRPGLEGYRSSGIHWRIVCLRTNASRTGNYRQAASAGTAEPPQTVLLHQGPGPPISNFSCRAFLLWSGKAQLWFLVSLWFKCRVWVWWTLEGKDEPARPSLKRKEK